jgi:hypothetical protein
MLLLLHPRPARRIAGRAGYWLLVRVVLVVVAVARRKLGPSWSIMTSTLCLGCRQSRSGQCYFPSFTSRSLYST